MSVLRGAPASAEVLENVAKRAHLANINALIIFTSQEGLSTGRYKFTGVGVDMEIYHLPFTYYFHNDSDVEFFLVGNVGYSRTYIGDGVQIPPGSRLSYENHLRTYTAGAGGGIRYKATEETSFAGGIELIYSWSGISIDNRGRIIDDIFEDFFGSNYNENLSYRFFGAIEYRPEINDFLPYIKLTHKLYQTKSAFTFDELVSFRTDSSVTTLSLGLETPALYRHNRNYFTLEGYLNGNYLTGAVVQSVKFHRFGTAGIVAYWYTPKTPWWASRFFAEASMVRSDGLDGYNIGIGFTVDF